MPPLIPVSFVHQYNQLSALQSQFSSTDSMQPPSPYVLYNSPDNGDIRLSVGDRSLSSSLSSVNTLEEATRRRVSVAHGRTCCDQSLCTKCVWDNWHQRVVSNGGGSVYSASTSPRLSVDSRSEISFPLSPYSDQVTSPASNYSSASRLRGPSKGSLQMTSVSCSPVDVVLTGASLFSPLPLTSYQLDYSSQKFDTIAPSGNYDDTSKSSSSKRDGRYKRTSKRQTCTSAPYENSVTRKQRKCFSKEAPSPVVGVYNAGKTSCADGYFSSTNDAPKAVAAALAVAAASTVSGSGLLSINGSQTKPRETVSFSCQPDNRTLHTVNFSTMCGGAMRVCDVPMPKNLEASTSRRMGNRIIPKGSLPSIGAIPQSLIRLPGIKISSGADASCLLIDF